MSQIYVNNLTFYYNGSPDLIFENASFSLDTNWKLGLIGRNGKGKTTLLNLLLGKYEYQGTVTASVPFDLFPYPSPAGDSVCAADCLDTWKAGCELWRVFRELDKLHMDAELLYRPFQTLSHGERTKAMLAVLFSGENDFLLIDEPTNHLDRPSREAIQSYLTRKKGFILASHDRELLDACVDHVLVLNRQTIEVQAGNFSAWWENKSRKDAFSQSENEKHKKEIDRLKKAAARTRTWAKASEQSKIGFDPIRDPGHGGKRAYIGEKTRKMQSRAKQAERRLEKEIQQKEGLLKDIENPAVLKLFPLVHHKETLLLARAYGMQYKGADKPVFQNLEFSLRQGERIFLNGCNGCGKSSLIRAVLSHASDSTPPGCGFAEYDEQGTLTAAAGLTISWVSQDTSFLEGSILDFCQARQLEESLFCAILRQLGLDRAQLARPLEELSQGQKKKVLLAASLMTPAHLYIWDEPLNYIDIFSRMQIEKLLLMCRPTMLAVEHDVRFCKAIATKTITF